MHQHQLLTFASKFELMGSPILSEKSFSTPDYELELLCFRSPSKALRRLTDRQLEHLKQHYITVESLRRQDLGDLDRFIQVWYRCRKDKTDFHCREYRRSNSTRLNHLACIEQTVDANARFAEGVREYHPVARYFYVYVEFYCVHTFRGKAYMLMYSSHRQIDEHDALVEDRGRGVSGFQDITVLRHLCVKVTGHGGKVYFVDVSEVMEERLRDELMD